ncbi:unnamed protein product [Hymenolepis diminuta]|uniref:Uncharacterized protein n=1 Tax=Hymenolepis diminuta TaxID=6216 RepID=A0A564Z2U1_HYMDI|nr:unnamed protein product [Hymenolepis diminuta]
MTKRASLASTHNRTRSRVTRHISLVGGFYYSARHSMYILVYPGKFSLCIMYKLHTKIIYTAAMYRCSQINEFKDIFQLSKLHSAISASR